MKRVLHVGCGKQGLPMDNVEEIRLDLNPECYPDIVASMTDMGEIGSYDVVFGCHVLEHFTISEVRKVMQECLRVLNPGGVCMMIVPNLAGIKPTNEVVYQSEAGPITGLDMFYGKWDFVDDHPFMAHKTGFVEETIKEAFQDFTGVTTKVLADYNLMCVGVKPK